MLHEIDSSLLQVLMFQVILFDIILILRFQKTVNTSKSVNFSQASNLTSLSIHSQSMYTVQEEINHHENKPVYQISQVVSTGTQTNKLTVKTLRTNEPA